MASRSLNNSLMVSFLPCSFLLISSMAAMVFSISAERASISLSLSLIWSPKDFRCTFKSSMVASLLLISTTSFLDALRASISLISFFSSVRVMEVVSCFRSKARISLLISSTDPNLTLDLASFFSLSALSLAFLTLFNSARMACFSLIKAPFFSLKPFISERNSANFDRELGSSMALSILSCTALRLSCNSLTLADKASRSSSNWALLGLSALGMGLDKSNNSSTGLRSSRLRGPFLLLRGLLSAPLLSSLASEVSAGALTASSGLLSSVDMVAIYCLSLAY
mmetsp:Transcript_17999/g.37202  ORF Transcript_17999/g.37202 Transcript_17999/m.37202 type:complete len:282 (+) Transcript_17999:963-1808(+)